MSLLNSVLGSISPSRFRDSFEDPRAPQHELPFYSSPSSSRSPSQAPRIPPPITSTVLWSVPPTNVKPAARVPDDLLALQRRARHLEQQLQDLLDAQADGLMSGLSGDDSSIPDDLISNGSTTPTVSSVRSSSFGTPSQDENMPRAPRKKKPGLMAARKGIYKRIQQLAQVKASELDHLDADLQDVHTIVSKTDTWTQKRARLEHKISSIEEGDRSAERTQALHTEASTLAQEIAQREAELTALKARHKRVLAELDSSENAAEARLSSYKASLAILNTDVTDFLARAPDTNYAPDSSSTSSSYLSLPPSRRTLALAHDYWTTAHARLLEKCEDVDVERAALDEGALLWNDVVTRIVGFESALQDTMARRPRSLAPAKLLDKMDATIAFLEEKIDFVREREWNLLHVAISAELEAFRQGREMLEGVLGKGAKGKRKQNEGETLLESGVEMQARGDTNGDAAEEEISRSAIRIGKQPVGAPAPTSPPKPKPQPSFFDHETEHENEDPDPELMISHQDTDTD